MHLPFTSSKWLRAYDDWLHVARGIDAHRRPAVLHVHQLQRIIRCWCRCCPPRARGWRDPPGSRRGRWFRNDCRRTRHREAAARCATNASTRRCPRFARTRESRTSNLRRAFLDQDPSAQVVSPLRVAGAGILHRNLRDAMLDARLTRMGKLATCERCTPEISKPSTRSAQDAVVRIPYAETVLRRRHLQRLGAFVAIAFYR